MQGRPNQLAKQTWLAVPQRRRPHHPTTLSWRNHPHCPSALPPQRCLLHSVVSITPLLFLDNIIFIALRLFLDGIVSINLWLELHDVASIVAQLFLKSISSISLWLYPMSKKVRQS